MEPLSKSALSLAVIFFAAVLACLAQRPSNAQSPSPTSDRALFAQSAAETLQHDFPDQDISYLLFDARTESLLASRWENADRPIPLGSLVKPFTALAYAEHHDFRYPAYICRGAASQCWQPKPHGSLEIVAALAVSCNSYFRQMAATIQPEQMRSTAARFGLDLPPAGATSPSLMGLGDEWLISPQHMAGAYLELVRRRDQPGVAQILDGMRQAAARGTGAPVNASLKHTSALVKTGTAVCRHEHRAPGDGFVIALVPASQPELLLMIRVHGVPGASAATTAGRMLARLEQ